MDFIKEIESKEQLLEYIKGFATEKDTDTYADYAKAKEDFLCETEGSNLYQRMVDDNMDSAIIDKYSNLLEEAKTVFNEVEENYYKIEHPEPANNDELTQDKGYKPVYVIPNEHDDKSDFIHKMVAADDGPQINRWDFKNKEVDNSVSINFIKAEYRQDLDKQMYHPFCIGTYTNENNEKFDFVGNAVKDEKNNPTNKLEISWIGADETKEKVPSYMQDSISLDRNQFNTIKKDFTEFSSVKTLVDSISENETNMDYENRALEIVAQSEDIELIHDKVATAVNHFCFELKEELVNGADINPDKVETLSAKVATLSEYNDKLESLINDIKGNVTIKNLNNPETMDRTYIYDSLFADKVNESTEDKHVSYQLTEYLSNSKYTDDKINDYIDRYNSLCDIYVDKNTNIKEIIDEGAEKGVETFNEVYKDNEDLELHIGESGWIVNKSGFDGVGNQINSECRFEDSNDEKVITYQGVGFEGETTVMNLAYSQNKEIDINIETVKAYASLETIKNLTIEKYVEAGVSSGLSKEEVKEKLVSLKNEAFEKFDANDPLTQITCLKEYIISIEEDLGIESKAKDVEVVSGKLENTSMFKWADSQYKKTVAIKNNQEIVLGRQLARGDIFIKALTTYETVVGFLSHQQKGQITKNGEETKIYYSFADVLLNAYTTIMTSPKSVVEAALFRLTYIVCDATIDKYVYKIYQADKDGRVINEPKETDKIEQNKDDATTKEIKEDLNDNVTNNEDDKTVVNTDDEDRPIEFEIIDLEDDAAKDNNAVENDVKNDEGKVTEELDEDNVDTNEQDTVYEDSTNKTDEDVENQDNSNEKTTDDEEDEDVDTTDLDNEAEDEEDKDSKENEGESEDEDTDFVDDKERDNAEEIDEKDEINKDDESEIENISEGTGDSIDNGDNEDVDDKITDDEKNTNTNSVSAENEDLDDDNDNKDVDENQNLNDTVDLDENANSKVEEVLTFKEISVEDAELSLANILYGEENVSDSDFVNYCKNKDTTTDDIAVMLSSFIDNSSNADDMCTNVSDVLINLSNDKVVSDEDIQDVIDKIEEKIDDKYADIFDEMISVGLTNSMENTYSSETVDNEQIVEFDFNNNVFRIEYNEDNEKTALFINDKMVTNDVTTDNIDRIVEDVSNVIPDICKEDFDDKIKDSIESVLPNDTDSNKISLDDKADMLKEKVHEILQNVFEGIDLIQDPVHFAESQIKDMIIENVLDIIADKTGIDIKSVTEEFKNDLKEEIMDTFSDVFNGISEKLSEMFSPDIELTEVAFEKAADELCVDMGTEIIGAADEIVSSAIEEAIVEAVVI